MNWPPAIRFEGKRVIQAKDCEVGHMCVGPVDAPYLRYETEREDLIFLSSSQLRAIADKLDAMTLPSGAALSGTPTAVNQNERV